MSQDQLAGVHCALATPFQADSFEIDEAALRSLVDAVIDDGVQGLVLCGSTGEFTSLTTDERQRVVEIATEQAAGRVAIIPQVGSCSVEEAKRLAAHAESVGADAMLAITPYYEPLEEEEATAYYETLAEASSVPIVYYNLPSGTGVNVTSEQLGRLCDRVPTIRYIKDSAADLSQIGVLVADLGDRVKVLNGWDTLFLPALEEGALGAILGTPNFVAKPIAQIYESHLAGDRDDAWSKWLELRPLMQVLVRGAYVQGVRAGMELTGRGIGAGRPPLLPLGDGPRTDLEDALSRLGALAGA